MSLVVVTTAHLNSTKPELKLCADSYPARERQRLAMVRISDRDPGWK